MTADITNSDLTLCRERHKKQFVRLYLLDDRLLPIDELEGDCISGEISVDAGSEVRRTCNLTLHSRDKAYIAGEYNRIWFNRRIRVQLGFKGSVTKWYDMGIFLFSNCSYTYSGDTRTLSVQLSDLVTTLDGTHGGVLDGEGFCIESGHDIKSVLEDLLRTHTDLRDISVASIGEYGCLQGKSISWKQNRIDSGSSPEVVELEARDGTDYLSDSPYLDDYLVTAFTSGSELAASSTEISVICEAEPAHYIDMGSWHQIPYNLEFSSGTPLYEMLTRLRDLYPGYESYFDTDGQFVTKLIPTCEHDPDLLDYFDLEPLVIDESLNTDFSTIRNATRIYGKSIETDRYADAKSVILRAFQESEAESPNTMPSAKGQTGNIGAHSFLENSSWKRTSQEESAKGHILEINLEKVILASNLKLGFQMPEYDADTDTSLPVYLRINAYESSVSPLGEILEKTTPLTVSCTTRETRIHTSADTAESETVYVPMKLSFFQPGESYSFKYISSQNTFQFLGMYQVEAYVEDRSEESPFSVDKIGTRLQILSGGEYDDISDTTACQERAEYENWLAGRFNDSVSLTTVIIPFLDVNQKVRYRTFSNGEIHRYLIKSIQYSLMENTCSITMSRFYDLFPFILCS